MNRCLFFKGDQLWIRRTETGADPFFEPPASRAEPVDASSGVAAAAEPPAPGAEPLGLRALFDLVPDDVFALAGRARQVLNWRLTHRFCGACGAPLARHATEHAMHCEACDLFFYPRINPVVIALISRGDQILLAHKAGNALPFWSVIAGFVEAGETLEGAVSREASEEVGVRVKNIRYASSQPWPFPNNLMIGFTAEHAGGDIVPDGQEITEAGWFDRDHLPPIPSRFSIARRLIDAFFAERDAPAQNK